MSENGGPCTRIIFCRAPPHLQRVGGELGIPAEPCLPSQGAGHTSRTASTQSGSWASQQDCLYLVRELGIPAGCLYPVRELGIPAGCLPGQGAGHPSRMSTQSGSWASQQDCLYMVRELGIPAGPHLPGHRGQWLGGRCWEMLTRGQARVCSQTLGLLANLSLRISLVRAHQVL